MTPKKLRYTKGSLYHGKDRLTITQAELRELVNRLCHARLFAGPDNFHVGDVLVEVTRHDLNLFHTADYSGVYFWFKDTEPEEVYRQLHALVAPVLEVVG